MPSSRDITNPGTEPESSTLQAHSLPFKSPEQPLELQKQNSEHQKKEGTGWP